MENISNESRILLEESDYGRHSEYRDMAEKLFGILRMIDIPDKQDGDEVVTRKAKASKMNYQIIENVLQFFVNYKIKAKLILPEEPKMQVLEIQRMEDEE